MRPVNGSCTLRPYREGVNRGRALDTDVTGRYRCHMTDEERQLREALATAEGSPTKAAVLLGVTRMTIHRRMKKYGIEIQRVVKRAA